VSLINQALRSRKIVIEAQRIDSAKVRRLFETGNFRAVRMRSKLVVCLWGSEGKSADSSVAGVRPDRQEIRIWKHLATAAEDFFEKPVARTLICALSASGRGPPFYERT